MVSRRLCATLLVLAASVPGAAGAVAPLEVRLTPGSITVGDRVEVTVELPLRPGDGPAELLVPTPRWGPAEVLEPARLVEAGAPGGPPRTWRLVVTAFETGTLELPPLAARLGADPGEIVRAAGPATLEVASVLPAGEASPPPAPPVPPRPLPLPAAFWWSAGILGAALAASALALGRRTVAARGAGVAALSARAELERELAALGGAEPEADLARLSLALRRFLGHTCGFPAAESTTTEVARRLAGRGLDAALTRPVRALLAECDGVKFARRPASAATVVARRERALELAAGIEHALAPPPEAPR